MPTADRAQESILSPLKLFEIDFELIDTRTERIKKIRWIIRLRFAISAGIVALMFFTGWQGLTQQPDLTRNTLVATLITSGVAFLLNIAYYLALRRQINLSAFVFLQLLIDIFLFTSYVYRTGGVTSPFSFLYMLPIIAGAILVSSGTAVALAVLASACFGTLAVLGGVGALEHVSYFVDMDIFVGKWNYVSLMLIVNPFSFFAVAGLASFLMTQVRSKTDALTQTTLRLDRQAQMLQMLYQVSRSAVLAKNQAEVVNQIGQLLVRGLNLDRVLFYLVSPDRTKLVLAREFYHPRLHDQIDRDTLQVEIPLTRDAGVTARCALDQKPENVPDPLHHPLINQGLAERIGLNPFAVAPMVAHRELIGVLGVDRKFELGVLDDDDFQILIAFADQAAVALRTSQLERRVDEWG